MEITKKEILELVAERLLGAIGGKPVVATQPQAAAAHCRIGQYCIVRTYSVGVFAGIIMEYNPATGEARIKDSRRLWRWWSAFTLSELAMEGVRPGKAAECKFAAPIPDHTVCEVIEMIPCSDDARKLIEGVPNARP